jgi:hypothetical protein
MSRDELITLVAKRDAQVPPQGSPRRGGGPKRSKGKQPGTAEANLAWTGTSDERTDRFPEGSCQCGHDLADARDLGGRPLSAA